MTEERSKLISDVLVSNVERAKELLSMSPEKAVEELKKEGYDFSEDELIEFGKELQRATRIYNEKGELTEEDLGNISGGCHTCMVAGVFTVAIGIAFLW